MKISMLEAQGYGHIECWCETCRVTVWVPFAKIRRERPRLDLGEMTIAELGKRMRCSRCGGRPENCREVRQSDAPGFQRSYNYPKW
ncbi:hypothetical protein VRZ08_05395 [Rhodopseudomonas sp. G2_2311]|uniref:hypothetical protein n=1 Tax=Rhodopseudomonas sp. G2_2311 TaxID=3114287 RepID=UPI0039C6339C